MRDALRREGAQLQPRFRLPVLEVARALFEGDKLTIVGGNDAPTRVRRGNSKPAIPDRLFIRDELERR